MQTKGADLGKREGRKEGWMDFRRRKCFCGISDEAAQLAPGNERLELGEVEGQDYRFPRCQHLGGTRMFSRNVTPPCFQIGPWYLLLIG